jgi:hypothetical protein
LKIHLKINHYKRGFPINPWMIGANAVLNPNNALTKTVIPVISRVFIILFDKRPPSSPNQENQPLMSLKIQIMLIRYPKIIN